MKHDRKQTPSAVNYAEQKRFSIVKRLMSLTHAGRGLRILIQTQHNAWVHIAIALFVAVLGIYFKISIAEWVVIILSMGLVIGAEAVNTAIEIDIDLTSPNYHPYARDTKDVAAGAVLIAFITSAIIYIIIFGAKVIQAVQTLVK